MDVGDIAVKFETTQPYFLALLQIEVERQSSKILFDMRTEVKKLHPLTFIDA